jgi:hypothetical protein
VNLDHVFATATAVVNELGYPVTVQGGSHWLAGDPLVLARPELFSPDCRYGLSWGSVEPPACLSVPPGEDDPSLAGDDSGAAMTSRVRSRSQAARAQASR